MDFDDLTQHLLATFLNNNNGNNEYDDGDDGDNGKESKQPDQLKQHKFNYGNSLVSEPTGIGTSQLLNLTSSSSIFSSIPASTVFPIAPLPKPEPLQVSRLYLWDFILGIMLAIVTLATVIGNLLVIAAILRERHLRSVGNYLVFSLAVADLMVACLVMPLGALYVVTGQWTLGAAFCDLWTVADVLCCTASILHLLAIAMDRFWAVTNVDYIHQRRNGSRIGMMIFLIWVASFIISLAPIFGWRDPDFPKRIAQQQCLISQDVTYQIFATCSSFYVPLLLILLLYWRIYKVARKRIRRKPGNKVTLVTMQTNSNASNPNVETKVLKGMNNMSKTSKRLAKYSAAKYLQKQGSRLASDMMSLDTDHQYLRASADSLASNVSNNPTNENGKAISDSNFVRKKMEESSTSSSKRFSITRTTMTSLSMSNNHSDPQQCSTMTSINGTNDYSIIIEEGSSSSSNVNANRPNTSTSANNVCVVNGVQSNGPSSSSSSTAPAGSTMAPFDDRSDCHNLSSSSPSMHLANHNHQHHQHNHHCICQQPFNRHFHNEANNSMDGHKFANEDMTSLPDGDNNGNDDGEHQLYAKKEMNERMCDSPPPPPPSPPNRTTTVTTTTTTMTPALLLQHSMSKTNDVNQSVLYEQVSSFSTDRYRVDHSNQTTPCNTHADPYCDDDRRLVNSNVVDDVTHNENEKKEKKEMEEEEGKGKK
ncbi:hypothetical protein RDWZM_003288 [Blomia tropicalis]|uniref:G-protein coupled receptors family 1 profile domain-containing protein n=1 Tax=Blomia tropicalis TaxID=40697 RepID=A0A9Q0MGL5_BLOTA|nr:hypothetical protein RDWZM_003288 [Blomia tropicalis]